MDAQIENWLFSQAAYYLEYLQPKKSIALLEALQILDPENPDVVRMLSYAYLENEQFEESIVAADLFLRQARSAKDIQAIKWIKGRASLKKKQLTNPPV